MNSNAKMRESGAHTRCMAQNRLHDSQGSSQDSREIVLYIVENDYVWKSEQSHQGRAGVIDFFPLQLLTLRFWSDLLRGRPRHREYLALERQLSRSKWRQILSTTGYRSRHRILPHRDPDALHQRSGAGPAQCAMRSNDDLRQLALPPGSSRSNRSSSSTATLH